MDYYSRTQEYTINTQDVVGYNLLFLDIATGYPESLHDARILRSSTLYVKAESGDIFSRPVKIVDGYCIKHQILSDSVYLSTTWQVNPYNFNVNLIESQSTFNKQLSATRVTVKRAFRFLKGCWRCLLKCLNNRLSNASDIIITCCTLHNIWQERSDEFIDEDNIVNNILDDERGQQDNGDGKFRECRDAEVLREILTVYVSNNM